MFPALPALLQPDFSPSLPGAFSYLQVPTALSYIQIPDNTFPVGNADSQELAVLSFPESGSHRILRSAENHDLADNSDHHYEKQL